MKAEPQVPNVDEGKPVGGWSEFFEAVKPLVSAATKIVHEERLGTKTTMRVGGAARIYAEPASVADLQVLLREARAWGGAVLMLGRGSNVIVPDEGVNGLVVSLAHQAWSSFEPREDGRVAVGAGLRLKNLCGLAAKAGLVGFEFLEGIPGNIGGALRMNAGAMGAWMFDVVEDVQLMTRGGEVRTLTKAAMHVGCDRRRGRTRRPYSVRWMLTLASGTSRNRASRARAAFLRIHREILLVDSSMRAA